MIALFLGCASSTSGAAPATPAAALRLVPFPKEVQVGPGVCVLKSPVRLIVDDEPLPRFAANALRRELAALLGVECRTQFRSPSPDRFAGELRVKGGAARPTQRSAARLEPGPGREGYALAVRPDGATVAASSAHGLANGMQTLRQLIRANAKDRTIPCVRIRDWPSLRYRGYSDDITRGPSPPLGFIQAQLRTASLLKMNFWTYYMEYQYAFAKHPTIGPKDGSLTPAELTAVVAYGNRCGVEIIGNQQSFGHFSRILAKDKYKRLREKPHVLNPTHEGTYKLLDDFYSEVAPLLTAEFFNVCCDETWGLGTGPSKALADKIGVGGVYANHLRRVHDLLKTKYGKRMMMWGDIIIKHPEHLAKIPKDTIVLSWGYHAAPSFDRAITPFSKSGYEFFVCPGVSCWSRILPDFGVAVTNIHNYVRDGAKHGTLGMLNTTWDDDGENFFAPNWHGLAWGAECAWNASKTSYEDFSRRIGAILFGTPGDHFGRAIDLLAKTHRLPGYGGMHDRRFWKDESGKLPVDAKSARRQAESLLAIVKPALEHLRAAKASARVNGDWLDTFIFGAERMRLMATRTLGYLEAARAYADAYEAAPQCAAGVQRAEGSIRKIRDEYARLKRQYVALWRRESKPYALDWVTRRFDAAIKRYDDRLGKLRAAAEALRKKEPLPSPGEVGLALVELGARRTRPTTIVDRPLSPSTPWQIAHYAKRVGLVVDSGSAPRIDVPVEVDLPVCAGAARGAALCEIREDGGSQRIWPAQLRRVKDRWRLSFVARGRTPAKGQRRFLLYHDLRKGEASGIGGVPVVTCSPGPNGATWIENPHYRLLVGQEGGHIYRWEIKSLGNRDVTHPGRTGWSGFADVSGAHRSGKNRIEVLANGPAMVRLKCTDQTGLAKIITAYAGLPWIEVALNSAVDYFWCFTDTRLMAADSPTPGTALFSDGRTGKVKTLTSGTDCQIASPKAHWCAKYVRNGPLIALITPEVATRHVVGPGGGMGGVGVERSTPANHFVIYAGPCPEAPAKTLGELCATLDYRNQPTVHVHAGQAR